MDDLAFQYVERLQWVIHYYFGGVASWGWRYAPRISGEYPPGCSSVVLILTPLTDLKNANKMSFSFVLGMPFCPYEQLMGVLPLASKDQIPTAYHVRNLSTCVFRTTNSVAPQDLMYDPSSPILDFYALVFELDLNGKKQDWEAIIKIPFIDEKRLLKAMACMFSPVSSCCGVQLTSAF
jgi:5'-3' exoribonuclease 1